VQTGQTVTAKIAENPQYLIQISPIGAFNKLDLKKWLVGALITGGAVGLTYLAEHVGELKLTADQAAILVAVINLVLLFIKKIGTTNVELIKK
jgi:hypothetical protein